MVYRLPINNAFGTLSTAAAVSDTSLSSTDFPNSFSVATTTQVVPVVLFDDSQKMYEVVWVTALSGSSATVLRGQEGSSAQAWPSGTKWVCAPTAWDGKPLYNSTALPANAHTGMEVMEPDAGVMSRKTSGAGWQSQVGANISDIGPCIGGTQPPTGFDLLVRGGQISGTTATDGTLGVTFRTPFPNGIINVVATSTYFGPSNNLAAGPLVIFNTAKTGFGIGWINPSTAARYASATVSACYMAFGW